MTVNGAIPPINFLHGNFFFVYNRIEQTIGTTLFMDNNYTLREFIGEQFVYSRSMKMHDDCIHQNQLSNGSVALLRKIIIQMVKAENAFYKAEFIRVIGTSGLQSSQFHYIPNGVQTEIGKKLKYVVHYAFPIGKRNFSVHLVHENKNDTRTLQKQLKKIFMWFYVANSFVSSSECSRQMNIYIYFTSLLKLLPSRGAICQEHANSAFTTSCKPETEINVYREEEWFKVLIHETFHAMGLDFSAVDCVESNNNILGMFQVASDVRVFETYSETWAEIINVLFVSYFSSRRNENLDDFICKIILKTENHLIWERVFSLFQCAKVLNHYKLTYENLYKNTSNDHVMRTQRYKEKTQVFSYYILKCITMFYVNDFLEWCNENNAQKSIVFTTNSSNISDYCDFFREHYNKPNYVACLREFEEWFSHNVKESNKKSWVMQTLIMSITQ